MRVEQEVDEEKECVEEIESKLPACVQKEVKRLAGNLAYEISTVCYEVLQETLTVAIDEYLGNIINLSFGAKQTFAGDAVECLCHKIVRQIACDPMTSVGNNAMHSKCKRRLLLYALASTNGCDVKTSELIGISERSLHRWTKTFHVTSEHWRDIERFEVDEIPKWQEVEKHLLTHVMSTSDNSMAIAAERLGISKKTLDKKLRQYRNGSNGEVFDENGEIKELSS